MGTNMLDALIAAHVLPHRELGKRRCSHQLESSSAGYEVRLGPRPLWLFLGDSSDVLSLLLRSLSF